jgi:hypothetical protein
VRFGQHSYQCSRQKNYNKDDAQFVEMQNLQCPFFSAENDPERLNPLDGLLANDDAVSS